jgi:transcription elongation factor GreB
MSRAFVKEGSDDGADGLPERPLPAHANYVTPRGLAQLQARVRDLAARCAALKRNEDEGQDQDASDAKRELRVTERDLRYFNAQLERAELVPAALHDDTVHFGAQVAFQGDDGVTRRVRLVGDDEADAAAGDISWASPLARALIGARVGDTVTWRRPDGAVDIEILALSYDAVEPPPPGGA